MKAKQMANQIFNSKMEWVYSEIPSKVIPNFLTEDGLLRAVFLVSELGIHAACIKEELEKEGYKVTLNEPIMSNDGVLIDFKP